MSGKREKTVTSINGRLVRKGRGLVSVFDNSLLYAEGLFETMLAEGDRVILFDEHMARLKKGARVTGLELPVSLDDVAQWMRKTLAAHPAPMKKLRLTLTAGESARWVGVQGKPQLILSAASHQLPSKPFVLHLSKHRVHQESIFRRIKTISYAIHAAALRDAKQAGCDDALMLNQKDQIAEVTSANIFWVKGGKVYTPPLSAGCLDGVTRKVTLKLLRKMGHEPVERNATLQTLSNAEEVFITSSLKLVIGVSQIKGGHHSLRFHPGEITRALSVRMKELVGIAR